MYNWGNPLDDIHSKLRSWGSSALRAARMAVYICRAHGAEHRKGDDVSRRSNTVTVSFSQIGTSHYSQLFGRRLKC